MTYAISHLLVFPFDVLYLSTRRVLYQCSLILKYLGFDFLSQATRNATNYSSTLTEPRLTYCLWRPGLQYFLCLSVKHTWTWKYCKFFREICLPPGIWAVICEMSHAVKFYGAMNKDQGGDFFSRSELFSIPGFFFAEHLSQHWQHSEFFGEIISRKIRLPGETWISFLKRSPHLISTMYKTSRGTDVLKTPVLLRDNRPFSELCPVHSDTGYLLSQEAAKGEITQRMHDPSHNV